MFQTQNATTQGDSKDEGHRETINGHIKKEIKEIKTEPE